MEQPDRKKLILTTLTQLDKQFGKGSVLMLGSRTVVPVTVISSGSISIDAALGVGGFPRGRVIEIFGPESSGKTTLALGGSGRSPHREGRVTPNQKGIEELRRFSFDALA